MPFTFKIEIIASISLACTSGYAGCDVMSPDKFGYYLSKNLS